MRRATSLQVALDRYPLVDEWLQLLGNLGRSPATLDAYGRGVIHYLAYCTSSSVAAEAATLEDVSLYVRDLLPDGSAAVANSTLHQRLTAIRLWYDHLIFQGLCSKNPVPRGQTSTFRRIPDHAGFSRGLVARLIKLPHVPTEDEWLSILRAAASDTVRNRLMLAFAYYGALRRCELVALRIGDLDFAHRLITLRAETTKGKRSLVVCYSPVITSVLARYYRIVDPLPWTQGHFPIRVRPQSWAATDQMVMEQDRGALGHGSGRFGFQYSQPTTFAPHPSRPIGLETSRTLDLCRAS